MSEPYVGEIRIFAGSSAPRGWSVCDGQLLAVAAFEPLFSLLGTTYGGDGRTTFGLPDLRGRIPVHMGQGPGLSPHKLGQRAGTETEPLTRDQMPGHHHDLVALATGATAQSPAGAMLAEGVGTSFYADQPQDAVMAADMLQDTGGTAPHANMMPSLCVNFIIALAGIYPSRT